MNQTSITKNNLPALARKVVHRHRQHIEACKRWPLPYADALLDALQTSDCGWGLRELSPALQAMIPNLPGEVADGLVETKLRGLGLN